MFFDAPYVPKQLDQIEPGELFIARQDSKENLFLAIEIVNNNLRVIRFGPTTPDGKLVTEVTPYIKLISRSERPAASFGESWYFKPGALVFNVNTDGVLAEMPGACEIGPDGPVMCLIYAPTSERVYCNLKTLDSSSDVDHKKIFATSWEILVQNPYAATGERELLVKFSIPPETSALIA